MTEQLLQSYWLWVIIIWTIPWKGWALWRSARAGQKGWFIALLIINTVGILEILYLLVISKKAASQPQVTPPAAM